MNKKKIILAVVLTFFIIQPSQAYADWSLLSELVKQDSQRHCGYVTFANEADTANPQNSKAYREQIGRTKRGSLIVMSTEGNKAYGYCHIFELHMKYANNKKRNSIVINGSKKSQFQYARYPATTMDIALEVIDAQPTLISTGNPNRFLKEYYSPTEGQKVRVALHRGSDWGGYGKYDWVIVSVYPLF